MNTFRVSVPEWGHKPEDGSLVEAFSAENAARSWADANHAKNDYFTNLDVVVVDESSGESHRLNIEVEMRPSFFVCRARGHR